MCNARVVRIDNTKLIIFLEFMPQYLKKVFKTVLKVVNAFEVSHK